MPSVIRCRTAGNPAPKPSGIKKPVEVTTPQPAQFLNHPVFTQPKMNEIIIPALTDRHHRLMLCPPSLKTAKHGIRPPDNIGHQRPLSNVVFLCPSKTRTAFCRARSVYGGLYWAAARLAGAYAGRSNLIQSATQRLDPKGGGNSLLHRKPL